MKHRKLLRRTFQVVLFFLFCITASVSAQVGSVIWQEDFNTLNTSIWNIVVGDGTGTPAGTGWGNQELEYYNTPNVTIGDVPGETGNKALIIQAQAQAMGASAFTSGKVSTYGKLSIKYGLVEMRIRVPNLQTGLWPAAWLLGTTTANWPACGEMDMMEMGHNLAERTRQGYPSSTVNNYVGSNLIFYSAAAVTTANPSGAASAAWDVAYANPYIAATPMNDRFLIYRMYWSSSAIRYTVVDGSTETDLFASPFAITTESDEFQSPFYFLLNMAVGGTFTDATTNALVTAPLPAKMYIDYIKVSKWNNEGEVTIGTPLPAETGTFGVFTDNTATSNKLVAGTSSDIYAWNNFSAGTTAAYEGSNVIAWATTAASTWFGGGVLPRQPRNMSNFAGGNLRFRIKIPADVTFKVGITDNYTNQYYVNFPANTTTYGLTRDGNWGQATIPISALTGGIIALQSMQYMFAIVSVDGSLPASTFQLGLDDIYWDGGGTTTTVSVTGVTMSPTTASVAINATQQLTATIAPTNATNTAVTWTTSNSTIATVSTSGLVSGKAAGSATITVTTADQAKTATCVITVPSTTVTVTGVTMSPTTASVAINATQQLTATIAPTNATNKSVTWSTSNSAIATVSTSGLVTGKAAGSATISVTTADQAKTATCVVTITTSTVSVTGVTMSPTTASIAVNATTQLTATIAPTNATNKSVTWTTSNSATATVSTSGLVTGKAAGSATITVTTADQAKTATCVVTITAATLTDITNLGGTVSAQYSDSPTGEDITKLIDNSASTKYLTFHASGWVQYQVSTGYVITNYTITSANDAAERDPLIWTLQGSNNGTTWTTIDSRSGEDFATRLLKRSFSFSNTTSYTYYRLNMTNNSGTILQLAELELFGVVGTTTVPVTGVTMSPTTASIAVAGTTQLTATIAPTNATNKTVTWTTSNSSLATVSASGLVTGVAAGSPVITVTTQDGSKTATCNIVVTSSGTGCTKLASTGDFNTTVSNDASNPTLTFVPVTSGAGSTTCIVYYSTSSIGSFPGYSVTPNTAYRITAAAGSTVYFYYTYSVNGLENSTVNSKNNFVVGNCSSLKSEELSDGVSAQNNFSIFPNPARDEATVAFDAMVYNKLIVTDVTGRILIRQSIAPDQTMTIIDLNRFEGGNYYVCLMGNQSIVTKIMVHTK